MNSKRLRFTCSILVILGCSLVLSLQTNSHAQEPPVSLVEPTKTGVFHREFPTDDAELRSVQRQYNEEILPTLKKYCADCHWGSEAEADFNLEGFETLDQLLNGRKKWKKVVVRVAAKEMPPENENPLPESDRQAALNWIDHLLNVVDCTDINPGNVTIRRLNRTEYKNTIRDLVGLHYEPADQFPGDDVGYGFDNIADVLSLPPILMEKYLKAAEEITTRAIIDPSKPVYSRTINGNQFNKTRGSRPYDGFHLMTTNGTIDFAVDVPITGNYDVEVRAFGDQAGDESVQMSFGANGKSIGTKPVLAEDNEHGRYEFVAALNQGKNRLEVSFLNDYYEKDIGDRNLNLAGITIKGPIGFIPTSQKMLVPNSPQGRAAQRVEAGKALRAFMSRAYRRRVTKSELSRLLKLYDHARESGEGFELSIRFAFQAVLVSPHFLYKIESPTPAGKISSLTDAEMATSLSYFLWSTMPDEELLRLANKGKLSNPDVYLQQIKRMMNDPKAESLVENFVAQWLQLRHLEQFNPDPELFPGADEALRQDMATETKMIFSDLIQRDASILEILETEISFINHRLARHYGIDGVEGEEFRRVSMREHGRIGLMTQASILTLTSNPTRTSPVKRGKWIMENLLGEQPPPPDPAAMQLEDQAELTGTLRQRMEQHRADPACAGCHQVMDQLGFALENYDAVGKWREFEDANEIDATGVLPDGTAFSGAIELQQTVKTKLQAQFVRCLTEKMLIYSLGRGLEYFDECTVDKIVQQLEPNDYRFSDLIIAVATSDPFLKRYGTPVEDQE